MASGPKCRGAIDWGRRMQSVGERSRQLLAQSNDELHRALDAMYGDHLLHGRLSSGLTGREAIRIYQEVRGAALAECCDALAKRVAHRGRNWRSGMDEIREALNSTFEGDEVYLDALRLNMRCQQGDPVDMGLRVLLQEARAALHKELDAFAEGWTSPSPKAWHERNPVIYAMILLLLGALIGALVSKLEAILS